MMTDKTKMVLGLGAGLALMIGAAGIAVAQSSPDLSAALAAGKVGEQADGYLGIRSAVSDAVKDEIDAINIKRRDIYTKRAVASPERPTVKEMAAAIGCETLATRVQPGRAYQLPDGVWRVKGADPIALPAYCKG